MNTLPLNKAEIELFYWQYSGGDNFHSKLYELIAKADGNNLMNLAFGFPEEVHAFKRYVNEDGYWESVKTRMQHLKD